VPYALETTRAIAVCPFHSDVIIRVGDDAAETHAFVRATRIVKSDGKTWKGEALRKELDANSAKPLTVTVLTAPVWATPSYERLRLLNAIVSARRRSILQCPATE
jgi:hypothetical protein